MSDRVDSMSILQVDDLMVHFPIVRGLLRHQVGSVKAVDGITFEVRRGETFGLVGESGCGKTSAARAIAQLERPTSGQVIFEGQDLAGLDRQQLRRHRRRLQMIFQDPYASLNPRLTVQAIVSEPLRVHRLAKGKELSDRVHYLLEIVGLDPKYTTRYPHEFSGGQRQRIGIARALASEPSFVICDEPISALDVSIQAQVVNLLMELQARLMLTFLFIAHDLSMVRHISDRVAVMYLGQIMEMADKRELFGNPLHPYTVALLSAVPIPDPAIEARREQMVLEGEISSASQNAEGCRFASRCPMVKDFCLQGRVALVEVRPGHFAACLRIGNAG